MLFPIRTDVPLRRTPWMNWLLILASVIVFMIQVNRGRAFTQMLELNPRNASLIDYFTYAFAHGDLAHLLGNLLFLYIFGNNVNDRMGNAGYLGFYLASGVIAGVAHVLSSGKPVIGASGAVFGVTGAFMVLFPRSRVTLVYFFILIGAFDLAGMWFVLAYFALQVWQLGGGGGNTAYMAHIGGAVFGFAVCMLLLSLRLLPRSQFDLLALIDRWNRRRQYRDLVATGYNPFGHRVQSPGAGEADPQSQRTMELRAAVQEAMAHSNFAEALRLFMELRATDPSQVLSRQNQFDIANYLFEQGQHAAAADAYEGFLRVYPRAEQTGHVRLMLGLLYSRYLNRPDKAVENLTLASQRLANTREGELADEELTKLTRGVPRP
jgi:membrane associated rhomboid family serine protease